MQNQQLNSSTAQQLNSSTAQQLNSSASSEAIDKSTYNPGRLVGISRFHGGCPMAWLHARSATAHGVAVPAAFLPLGCDQTDSQELSASLSVIVPCYNEAVTVIALLRNVRAALPSAQIIVVDDGSTDGTRELLAGEAFSDAHKFIALPRNLGKGNAVRAGLPHARREFTIIQDADLEYAPTEILRLLRAAYQSPCLAVYGSRYHRAARPEHVPSPNYWAVKLLAVALWWRFRVWITDPATCYKLVRTELLMDLELSSNGFELCQEMTSKLLSMSRQAIVEVPISYHPRTRAQGKKIRWFDFFPSPLRALSAAQPPRPLRTRRC